MIAWALVAVLAILVLIQWALMRGLAPRMASAAEVMRAQRLRIEQLESDEALKGDQLVRMVDRWEAKDREVAGLDMALAASKREVEQLRSVLSETVAELKAANEALDLANIELAALRRQAKDRSVVWEDKPMPAKSPETARPATIDTLPVIPDGVP